MTRQQPVQNDQIVALGLLEPPEVHEAAGMLTVQLGVCIPDAISRLRTFAVLARRSPSDVALDVVDRRIRMGSDEGSRT